MFYPDFWWFLVVLPNSCGFWSCKNGGANSPSWGCTPWKSWDSGYGSSHWRPQTWQSIIFYLNLESIPGTCWTWSLNKGFWGFSHCSPKIFISKSLVHQWFVSPLPWAQAPFEDLQNVFIIAPVVIRCSTPMVLPEDVRKMGETCRDLQVTCEFFKVQNAVLNVLWVLCSKSLWSNVHQCLPVEFLDAKPGHFRIRTDYGH